MAYHRFRIGQRVITFAFGSLPGLYAITGVLPVADGVPFYRVKRVTDGQERAIAEPSLRPAPVPTNSNDTPPRRPRSGALGWRLPPACA
jgi:hypothetical protein